MQERVLSDERMQYLQLLARQFPTRASAYTEIINLQAILQLPRGTEHFISDVHGELGAFVHILNNSSGVIRERVERVFEGRLDAREQADLCTLIYYPEEKLELERSRGEIAWEWYWNALMRLIELARTLSDCYTRSHVRKLMPEEYAYIIDELLHVSLGAQSAHHAYHKSILGAIIAAEATDDFICSLAALIKRLSVARLHVVGDVYDRGPRGDRIVDKLMTRGEVDVQWGNHDIAWMGAAAGSEVCAAAVVRICAHYGTLDVLESSYGVSLRELALFADETYADEDGMTRLEKAANVILFKLMEQTIARHPNWEMEDRCLLGSLDLTAGTVRIGERDWTLRTRDFPTVDPREPSRLTEGEQRVMEGLMRAFADSDRLRRHAGFLFDHGSVYLVRNNNLLFHGCIPLNGDGTFAQIVSDGKTYGGRALLDYVERMARRAWATGDQRALDWMWYLSCGAHSPLAGRVTKTFERAYVVEREAWDEPQDPYFHLARNKDVCERILREFGCRGADSHIVNGHTPVREADGDTPVRADGRLLVIDGGFCQAYHKVTGIAGYTLISDEHGMRLKAHKAFQGIRAALLEDADIVPAHELTIFEAPRPLRVCDTDTGDEIRRQISDLDDLLAAYNAGILGESCREG